MTTDDDGKQYIEADECAVTTDDKGQTLKLLIAAKRFETDEVMPAMTQYLVACFMRHDDEDFVREQCAWLQAKVDDNKPN